MDIRGTDVRTQALYRNNAEGGVNAMSTNRRWIWLLILSCLFLSAGTGIAKLTEPDNIIYGPVTVNGLPVVTGEITLTINGNVNPLVRYALGSNAATANVYILRVPLDSYAPRDPDAALQGEVARIYLNGQLVASAAVGPRGSVTKIPLDTCTPLANYYPDADNDGYPGTGIISSCIQPVGYKTVNDLISTETDCNDLDAAVNPGAAERCNGKDDNCNGLIDESGDIAFYRDADADGYGNPLSRVMVCTQPAGYVFNNTDCNDSDPKEHPAQIWYKDSDGDGYSDMTRNEASCNRPVGYKISSELISLAADCDDSNASTYPGAVEICDRKDNDCDGAVDNQCLGDAGKMCRNSHYLNVMNWLIRAYTVREDNGLYSVYLEVLDPNGVHPDAAITGMLTNPLLISSEGEASDITMVFDEAESAAYILYTTAAGQALTKAPVGQ